MILSIQNTSIKIFIPIFQMRQRDNAFMILDVLFFLLFLLATFVSYHHVIIFWTVRKFHPNMTILMCFTFGSWVEVFVSIVVTWPYRAGIISINDTGETFAGFESDEMTIVTKIPTTIPLFIGSFLFWHYLATNIAGAITVVIERGIASFLFNDYEKNQRKRIATFLLILSQFVLTIIVAVLFFYIIDMKTVIIIGGFIFSLAFVFIIYLIYYNVKLRNKLDLNITHSYSLTARFQAAENVRSFKLIGSLVIVVSIFTLIVFIMMAIVNLKLATEEIDQAFCWLFETIVTLNPLFLVPCTLNSIPEWKHAFWQRIPFLRHRITPMRTNTETRNVPTITNTYFDQLQASWH